MTKLTDNIPFHLSNRVNILRSDFNWLSLFQGNWSHALLRIAIMFSSSNISPIVAFGLLFLFFCMCVVRHWVYLSFLFSLKDIVSKSMCYEVSGFIDCMRFKSIFYKPNIHFPWFSECHACLYSRIVPLSYFKQHEALKLKEGFFFFIWSWILFTRVSGMKGSCVVWYCASESFHWRKESCHMVYQGSARADVFLGRCHGFKVASILSDSHGERITAAAEIIVRNLSRYQCLYIQRIVMSWLPPPYYHHHPVAYSPPFSRLPTGVGVWERRGWRRVGGDEAPFGSGVPHHRRCLNAESASPQQTGFFRVHARWCPRGSRKGA